MVYILNKYGKPLMPTNRHGKVKHLLKNNQAKVVNTRPFTIQLLYETNNYTQDLTAMMKLLFCRGARGVIKVKFVTIKVLMVLNTPLLNANC